MTKEELIELKELLKQVGRILLVAAAMKLMAHQTNRDAERYAQRAWERNHR